MKKYWIIILLGLIFVLPVSAQKYFLYELQPGENSASVAQKFSVTTNELASVNTELQKNKDAQLPYYIIPSKQIPLNFDEIFFTLYEVSPQETIFSISRSYEISMELLKQYNAYLFYRELDVNDVLKIPVSKLSENPKEVADINQSVTNSSFGRLKHLVLPKETKYSIAKKYGISIEELEEANPNVANLQPGQFLTIVRTEATQGQLYQEAKPVAKEEIKYVEVSKRENIRTLLDKYNTSQQRIEELNPALRYGGFSDGMVLKMPTERTSLLLPGEDFVNLENFIQSTKTHQIALMLPFQRKVFENDSIDKSVLFKRNQLTRVAVDFYAGAKMAIDSATQMGIKLDVKVFDTGRETSTTDSIMKFNDFSTTQAIVGPVTDAQLKSVVTRLPSRIPVFSPLLNPNFNHASLVNTVPKEEDLQDHLISFIYEHMEDKNIVAFTDKNNAQMRQKLSYSFPEIRFVSLEKEQLARSDIKKQLNKDKENWFILETNDFSYIESFVSFLFSLKTEAYDIRLLTSSRSNIYGDEIPNAYLSKLQFTHTSTSKELVSTSSHAFNTKFKNKFGYYPNRFAVRGFDLMYDIILRLAYADNFYDTLDLESYTQFFESKFDYRAYDFQEGVYNSAVYLIQYEADLSTSVISLPTN
jgi:LysM repeat protein